MIDHYILTLHPPTYLPTNSDMWSAAGHDRWYLLPFFWVTQVVYSYYWYLKQIHTRPKREAQVGVSMAALMVISILWILWAGYGKQFFYLFWVPHLLAVSFLAFSFDYAPHRPHDVTR